MEYDSVNDRKSHWPRMRSRHLRVSRSTFARDKDKRKIVIFMRSRLRKRERDKRRGRERADPEVYSYEFAFRDGAFVPARVLYAHINSL